MAFVFDGAYVSFFLDDVYVTFFIEVGGDI